MNSQHYTASFSVAQSPAAVFAAVTNPRAWWSGEIKGPDRQARRRVQLPLSGHSSCQVQDHRIRAEHESRLARPRQRVQLR